MSKNELEVRATADHGTVMPHIQARLLRFFAFCERLEVTCELFVHHAECQLIVRCAVFSAIPDIALELS